MFESFVFRLFPILLLLGVVSVHAQKSNVNFPNSREIQIDAGKDTATRSDTLQGNRERGLFPPPGESFQHQQGYMNINDKGKSLLFKSGNESAVAGKKERIFLGDDTLLSFNFVGAGAGGKLAVGGGFYGGAPFGGYAGFGVGLPHYYRPFSLYGPPGPILSGGVFGSYGVSGYGGSLALPGGYYHHKHHHHNFHGHGYTHYKYNHFHHSNHPIISPYSSVLY